MEETELFEQLLEISGGALKIELKGANYKGYDTGTKILVTAGKSSIHKNTLNKIIKIVDKNDAKLKLLPHGVIEILI